MRSHNRDAKCVVAIHKPLIYQFGNGFLSCLHFWAIPSGGSGIQFCIITWQPQVRPLIGCDAHTK